MNPLPHPPSGNIADLLLQKAQEHPDTIAIVFPHEKGDIKYTYAQLQEKVWTFMQELRENNIQKNDRVVILFPVSVQLYTLIAAIYSIGAVAVLIDPGMGLSRITSALKTAKPKALVSTKKALKFRWFIPALWRIHTFFCIDGLSWGCIPIGQSHTTPQPQSMVARKETDQALITFTSGSTGAPKGANRHHQFLLAQHHALLRSFPPHENQIDMTCFPVVVFHNLSCGHTTIIPDCDIAKPATMNPEIICRQLQQYSVTSLSAAPAFIEKLTAYLKQTNQTLPSLKIMALGGAPISARLQQNICDTLPHTDAIAVYGSTEAEPMAHHHIRTPIIEKDAFVAGTPVDFIQLKIVHVPNPPPQNQDLSTLETKEVGEIIVSGSHVNQGYIDNQQANTENKIKDDKGNIWHRTGDRGYFDENGCLWLTGRTNDIVHHGSQILDPFPIESRLLKIPFVKQAALLESNQKGYLFLSLDSNENDIAAVKELLLASENNLILCIADRLPVDGRHNSKIDRPTIRRWLRHAWWYARTQYKEIAQ
ncbi:MAG: hypothetical protein CL916_06615 [Deltaproteobacteria bacterium]|nr:hypothetical protein [Deltaproteobacteria bacterium]